jgi:hypothetical protein
MYQPNGHVGKHTTLLAGHEGVVVEVQLPMGDPEEQDVVQGMQFELVVAFGWNWPAGQGLQVGDVVAEHVPETSVPAGQLLGHGVHCGEEYPADGWYVPDGQETHCGFPSVEQLPARYRPGLHPAVHALQTASVDKVAAALWYVPVAQGRVTLMHGPFDIAALK